MQEKKHKRLKGIGGSEASAILGLNPYITNVDLWKIKTGREEKKEIKNKEEAEYGITMERLLFEMFKINNTQYEVEHKGFDLLYHKDYDFLFGSIDGRIVEKETGKKGVLEIKTYQGCKWNKWKDKIPDNYFCQVLHYLLCTGWDFAIVFALLKAENFMSLKTFRINRENVKDELDYLLKKELEFWEYVEKDIEPPLILPQI